MDTQRRELERRAAMSGGSFDVLARRRADKRAGLPGGLDLSLSREFSIVGAPNHPTYGRGLALLRKSCEGGAVQPYHNGLTRPLTFAENLRARLEDDSSVLWDTYLNSCTGVVYKKQEEGENWVEFKIKQESEDLLYLPENFNEPYWPRSFDSVEAEETFRTDEHACNQVLTPDMARNHRPWLAAAGYDQKLLKDYVERAEAKARENGNNLEEYFMNFWTVEKPEEDQLRSLIVGNADGSDAGGNGNLNDDGRFARVGLP